MKNYFIIINRAKARAREMSFKIKEYLEERGAVCDIDETDINNINEGYTDIALMPGETECVIVLGGDGTLLQAANDLADADVCFLGINFGTLGFLSEVDSQDVFTALDRLLADDFSLEERMMISGISYADDKETDASTALNDIVITRKGSMEILNLTVYINGQLMNKYYADGIIVATPTGSTGYSLSAGGPIINPVSKMIMLTPICPHSLRNRSIIFSSEDTVEVLIENKRDGSVQEVEAIFDGSHKVTLHTNDRIVINESNKRTKIIKLKQESFLITLQNKLRDI